MGRTLIALILALAAMARQPAVEKAWNLIAQGKRADAVALLEGIVRAEPRNAEARLLLGSILMEEGRHAESIGLLRDAVRLQPQSAEAHNALGEAYNAARDAKQARPEFEKAAALDPRHAQARINLAAILVEAGEFPAAAQHLDRAIALLGKTPDVAYPLYLRAKVTMERRELAKAAADLEQAVKLRPDFAEAWSDLGEARRNLADDAGAVEAFKRAVEANPEGAVARTRLGSKLLDLGKVSEAIPHLREAARLDPTNQSALNSLLIALRKDGRTDEANAVKLQLAQLLREKNRTDRNLLNSIELNNQGAALEKSGDLRGALEKYRAALELNPGHNGIRTNLAIALLRLGRWDEGLAQLREAARRDPANEQLQRALEDALAQAPKRN